MMVTETAPVTKLCRRDRGRRSGFMFNKLLISGLYGFFSPTAPLFARYRSSRPQDHKSARIGLYKHLGPSSSPISGAIHPGVPRQRSINASGPSTRTEISKRSEEHTSELQSP